MQRHLRWLVFFAVVSLSACRAATPRPKYPDNFSAARQAAAVTTRWIGMTDGSSCPVPATPDWAVRPLFPMQPLDGDLRRSALKAGLGRFCVYEYRGAEPDPELPQEILLRLRPGAEPDMVAMTTSADTLEVMTSDPFYERLREQVHLPTALPLRGSPARLVFLDTERTGDGIPAPDTSRRSQHGYALSHLAGHLASLNDEGPLAVEIASRLAMPVVGLDHGTEIKDLLKGGTRGTFEDLTGAIVDEIASWKRQPTRLNGPRHLVLNLSLGWDGETFGGWEKDISEMAPAVQAIHGVLELAADQGVLVIAAAGNERPGSGATAQPLLPGGWETRPRLDRTWKRRAAPLVYAVSGVDGEGHPLVNTRAQGEAPRVAYADHVVVPDRSSGEHTATLTGTSVAAAVVATTAALVWRYRPELSPAEVMQLLSRSGEDLRRQPDFSSDPEPGQVRRISLCAALQAACTSAGPTCPAFECGPPRTPASLESRLRALRPTMSVGLSTLATVPIPTNFRDSADQVPIDPQPGEDPCPNCVVTGPPRNAAAPFLSLPIGAAGLADPSFHFIASEADADGKPACRLLIEVPQGWNLLPQATLEVFDFNRAGRKHLLARHTMTLPDLTSLVPGEPMEVTGCFAEVKQGTPFQASLTFFAVAPDGGAPFMVESPLFVEY